MERYHKSYRIISKSERDPESNLVRALITIETSRGPVYCDHVANQRRDDSRTNVKLNRTARQWGIGATDRGFMASCPRCRNYFGVVPHNDEYFVQSARQFVGLLPVQYWL